VLLESANEEATTVCGGRDSLAEGRLGDVLHDGARGSPWILVGRFFHLKLDVGDAGDRFLAAKAAGARSEQHHSVTRRGHSACAAEGVVREPGRQAADTLGQHRGSKTGKLGNETVIEGFKRIV